MQNIQEESKSEEVELNPVQEQIVEKTGMLETLEDADFTMHGSKVKIKKDRRMKLYIKLTQEQTEQFEKVASVFKGAGIQSDDEIAAVIMMAGVATYISKIASSLEELEKMEEMGKEREAKEAEQAALDQEEQKEAFIRVNKSDDDE